MKQAICLLSLISTVDFYGYRGIDPEPIRKAILAGPMEASDALKQRVRSIVREFTGRDATGVTIVCCDQSGDSALFVGLPGSSSQTFRLNPPPRGDARLSPEILALHARREKTEQAAIQRGASEEDRTQGYSLDQDPASRALQLRVRQYALAHEAEVLNVLANSKDSEQRAIAAEVLGYVKRSPAQVAALVHASRDPGNAVRNNATRALGLIAEADPALARQIPAAPFIEMLRSGVWEDRNKATFLLVDLTASRDPELLAALKAQALDALTEMAGWKDERHAPPARIILDRIKGVP